MFICLTVCSRRYGFESHRPVQKQLLVMEQFSLKKYLKNPERKVVTRNGRVGDWVVVRLEWEE